jgi:hypothetical protein
MDSDHDEIFTLVDQLASYFGYYDGRIDLTDGHDLTTFGTENCAVTGHAPLWRIKPGQEQAVPIAKVREMLAKGLKWVKIARHDMHMARHPSLDAMCLHFVVKMRPVFLPINFMTVPVAFVVTTQETDAGLRIAAVDEWSAKTPEAARDILVNQCGWPTSVTFKPCAAFGAAS